MSTKSEQIASAAESDVGKTRDQVDCAGDYDWCAQYVSRVLNRCDISTYNTFVTPLHTALIESGLWIDINEPVRGAPIFFDWNLDPSEERPLDHVGIIVGVSGDTISYVNGNSGQDPDKVIISTIDKSSNKIIYITQYKDDAGGEFFTDKHIYDIGWPQSSNIKSCIDNIVASDAGGIIIGIGKLFNNSFEEFQSWADPNYNAGQAVAYAKTVTNVGVYVYNYATFGQDSKAGVQQALNYLTAAGISPSDLKLGIWLDIDSEGGGSSGDPYLDNDVNVNMINVKDFIDTCTAAKYPCVGIYTTLGVLKSSKFRCDYSFNIPIWCAWIYDGHMTFEQSSWEFMVQEVPSMANYTKVYLHQYSWVQRVPGFNYDLDGDKQFQPIPTSGGGGGGGGGTVTEVTVSIVAPKRIYFSPNPTVFLGETVIGEQEKEITISTDADNAEIYYTADGSAPYQYERVVGNDKWVYNLSETAVKYTEPVTITTDTHFRVIAVPVGTTSAISELLARGSGTFLFQFTRTAYSWEQEQYAYRLKDDENTKFFEENRQAFLRYHAEETAEEIVYNAVFAAADQSSGTVQPDDEEVDEGGHADE